MMKNSLLTFLLMGSLQAGYDTVFMPLDAMGFTENFNLYLRPENRLNPKQAPRTNNFQLWQTKFPTGFGFTPTNLYTPANYLSPAFRIASHLGTTGASGPGLVFPASNSIDFNPQGGSMTAFVDPTMMFSGFPPYFGASTGVQQNDYLAPTNYIGYNNTSQTLSSANVNMVFSAQEVNPAGFDSTKISTSIDPYGQSLNVTYTVTEGTEYLVDYVVLGNFFHDVYYNDLTPVLLSSSTFVQTSTITIYVDGVMQTVSTGDMVTGSSFVFPISGPGAVEYQLLVYAENATASDITLTITNSGSILATATGPYTGWLRAAYLPLAGGMPIVYGSNVPMPLPTGFPQPIPNTTGPISTNFIFNSPWFTEITVQGIAAQPFSFFSLFPYQWIDKVIKQTLLQTYNTGSNLFEWCGSFAGQYSLSPNGQTMALLVPFMSFDDSTITFTNSDTLYSIARGYLQDLTTNAAGWGGSIPTSPAPIGDSSQSLFSTVFAMGFMGGYASGTSSNPNDIVSFQNGISANRPNYGSPAPVYDVPSLLNTLDMYRSAIPTSCSSISYTDQSMTWKYTIASGSLAVMPHSGSTTTDLLIAFPGWYKLQNVSSLVDIQYDSGIKGQIFAAPATSSTITFVEDYVWPTWMSNGDFLPTDNLSTLFGTNTTDVECLLGNLYTNEQFPWTTATNVQWPNPGGFAPPLFLTASSLLEGYGTGKILFQLGMTSQYMQAYLNGIGEPPATIQAATEPLINFVKRILYDYLIIRPISQNFFVADSTNRGICFWGSPQPAFTTSLPFVSPPFNGQLGLEQDADQGVFIDFGNPIYNDHVLQYGYFIQAAAFVIEWDRAFVTDTANWWINQSILGADGHLYKMWHYVDLLWRDTVNPFLEEAEGLPFMRSTVLWEGHGSAGGTQNISPTSIVSPTNPGFFMPSGLNLESICEDYNDVLGTFRYAAQMLAISTDLGLTCPQIDMYTYLKNASFFNLKLRTSAARVLWYFIAQGYSDGSPGSELTPIYNSLYTDFQITAGNIFDVNMSGSVAFDAGQPTNPGGSNCGTGTTTCTPPP